MKTGVISLPLHSGSAPAWLFTNMVKLAREISIIIICEYGPNEYLKKISDPSWFQAFACVLGFDWHSSGSTTTTCAAIKEGLKPVQKDFGVFVCGGKGKTSRKTPFELEEVGQKYSFDAKPYVYASKMSAKVDNCAVQDGYQLYHHTFFATKRGKWAVIQQGMNPFNRWARRYHWLSDNVSDFVNEPQSAIISQVINRNLEVRNMVAKESKGNREISTKVSWQNPQKISKTIKRLKEINLPQRHHLLISDINPDNLDKIFLKTYTKHPKNFEELLGMEGVGPKTIRALSLISELIWGASVSTKDPARFSFAHGGKDGTPYPVNQKTYNKSIEILKEAVQKAKLGYYERLHALKRLC